MKELSIQEKQVMKLKVDKKSAINLAKHPISHGRSKHIEIKYHFLRDQVNKRKLELSYCKSEENVADILTKALKKNIFEGLRSKLGVCNLASLNQESVLLCNT